MPARKHEVSVLKKHIVLRKGQRPRPIAIQRGLSNFPCEYDSPVIWIPPAPSVWTFDFSLANRGGMDQKFYVLVTEFHFAPDQPSFATPPATSFAGRIFLCNWTLEFLGSGTDMSGWWARIFTTSKDVVPSIHAYADTPNPDSDPAVFPDFYFSPGDFMFFDLPGGYTPPVIGPKKP